MQFDDLKLIDPILRAVRAEGYTTPTPIQEQAIPYVLEGRDLLGCAQTGTGKTAAFALPILQHLTNNPRRDRSIRVLVLAPTRELASQIGDSFQAYGRNTRSRHVTIFGGVGQRPQEDALRRSPEILVATPGRLLDLMSQGIIRLDKVEILVLDEADRMLDMGFIHDVKRVIAAVPKQRQTLFFSATMPPEIQALADNILIDPAQVAVTPVASTVELIQQSIFFVEKNDKPALLVHILADRAIKRALVFTRTKHGANKVVRQLARWNIDADAIHGDKSQGARERALANFKAGQIRVLVATDIAARGLDVDNITHVINYDLSNEPETYVHRIGRTARAGASGHAYSFCDTEEREYLRDIERLIKLHVPVNATHPYPSPEPPPPPTDLNPRNRGNQPKKREPQISAREAQYTSRRPQNTGSTPFSHGRGQNSQSSQRVSQNGQSNSRPSYQSDSTSNSRPTTSQNGQSNSRPSGTQNGQSNSRPSQPSATRSSHDNGSSTPSTNGNGTSSQRRRPRRRRGSRDGSSTPRIPQ